MSNESNRSLLFQHAFSAALITLAFLLFEFSDNEFFGRNSNLHFPYFAYFIPISLAIWYEDRWSAYFTIPLVVLTTIVLLPIFAIVSQSKLVHFIWTLLNIASSVTLIFLLDHQRRTKRRANENACLAQERLEYLEQEIARRKHVEESFRQIEDRYQRMIETTAEGIWIVDAEGRIIFANARMNTMLGYMPGQLLHRSSFECTFDNDRDKHKNYLERTKEGFKEVFDFRLRHANGTAVWTNIASSPFQDQHSRYQGALYMITDITAKKHIEMSLSKNEKRLRIAQKAAKFGVWDWERTSNEVSWSEAYYELHGISPSSTPSYSNWLHSVYEEDRKDVIAAVKNTLKRKEKDLNIEFRILRSGEIRWLATVGQTTYDDKNRLLRITGTSIDITERKQLLERERNAREQAENANRAKDEFLATVSHELRTPLTSMLGWIRMFRKGKLDESESERALETIERNAKAQAQLIEDLLDISRIVSGKLTLKITKAELANIINDTIDSLHPAANAKSIELLIEELDPDANEIWGDPDRIQQIIWNLLSNAVKFTPQNGRVSVQLKRYKAHVEIRVQDNGIGIAADFLPYVFDRFRQEDCGSNRKFGGLGLGLAIVRHLVELHGGTISVTSPGKDLGTLFTIRLPVTALRPSSPTKKQYRSIRNIDSSVTQHERLQGLQILVVDDDQDTAQIIKWTLMECGASVRISSGAAEAIASLQELKSDIIISDIGMPGKNGYELIRQIRTMGQRELRTIPAIALTAFARVEDRIRALSAGFQMHVAKPVEPDELIEVISSLLGRTSETTN